jgi:uncharacterized protein YceH (UPF0502 family)
MLATRFGALLVAQTKGERRRRAMYRMNEIEFWNGRRHELVREAEDGRLARRLKVASPKRVARFRSVLFGRVPLHLRAQSSGQA